MTAKPNWNEIKQRFEAWWRGDLTESPLIWLMTEVEPKEPLEEVPPPASPMEQYTGVDRKLADMRNDLRMYRFDGDAYPSVDLNLGPGSMALYLGSEPVFREESLWYTECVTDWLKYTLAFDPDNRWWATHLAMLDRAQRAAGGEFYVNIPDLVENIDILAAMRGPQNTCYDLMDDPEIIARRIRDLDDLYFTYYDACYDLLKDNAGGSSYTAFRLWGPGKTAKVQCDFCAMMSPGQFAELIAPSLGRQCARLTNSIYHLDGPDAIKHVPALMDIPSLQALQWTPGAGNPDGGDECWYPVYDQARAAGKSLWIGFDRDDADTQIEKARRLVKRYGAGGLYIHFPTMREAESARVLSAAARGFR